MKSDPEECVFQALGFGLKSASAQSETVKEILACQIREKEPELALLLEDSTYVDDMGDSKTKLEDCTALINTADREFSEIGLKCKQWTLSGQKPSEIVSEDGLSILVGGSEWFPQVDAVSVRIPPLHFGKVRLRRGRLDKSTQKPRDVEISGFCFITNTPQALFNFLPGNASCPQLLWQVFPC